MKTLFPFPVARLDELQQEVAALLVSRVGKDDPEDRKCRDSPVYYVTSIGHTLYPWQEFVLSEPWTNLLLCAARQVGKTFLAACKARHHQRYKGSVTPIVCPNQDKSKIVIDRLKEVARLDPAHVKWDPDNAGEVGENGAVVKGLPGSLGGVVGLTAPLLMLDEAGLIPRDLYEAATPMQAHVEKPELWAMSNAWWQQGWFWEAWDKGTGWTKVLVRPPFDIQDGKIVDMTAAEQAAFLLDQKGLGINAFFSVTPVREFLEGELLKHAEYQVRQQYLCEFQPVEDLALPPEMLARAWRDGGGRRFGGESAISDGEGRRF